MRALAKYLAVAWYCFAYAAMFNFWQSPPPPATDHDENPDAQPGFSDATQTTSTPGYEAYLQGMFMPEDLPLRADSALFPHERPALPPLSSVPSRLRLPQEPQRYASFSSPQPSPSTAESSASSSSTPTTSTSFLFEDSDYQGSRSFGHARTSSLHSSFSVYSPPVTPTASGNVSYNPFSRTPYSLDSAFGTPPPDLSDVPPPQTHRPIPPPPSQHSHSHSRHPENNRDDDVVSLQQQPQVITNRTENTNNALRQLHSIGGIQTYVDELGAWNFKCPDCGAAVATGIRGNVRLGTAAGHYSTLQSHRSSKRKCSVARTVARAARDTRHVSFPESKTTPPRRQPSMSSIRASTAPLEYGFSGQPSADNSAMDDDDDGKSDHEFTYGRSSSAPPEAQWADRLADQPSRPDCVGVPLEWPAELGPFNDTFPWSRVGNGVDSLPFSVEVRDKGRSMRAIAKTCTGEAWPGEDACAECLLVPKRIQDLASIAREAKKHTNHRYLNASQLRDLLADRATELNRWKLKTLNMARKLGVAARRAFDCRRFAMAIAENDVPRVGVLVQTAIRNGASTSAIVNKIERAYEGLYHPRGFGARALDMAVLTYRLGGRSLLYAMNHGAGLPSLKTLRNHMSFTRIMPTVGTIIDSTIKHNIQETIIKPREESLDKKPPRGVSVLMDEIALEETAVHFRHSNSVGGLCWKHAPLVNLVLRTFESATDIAIELAKGTVHLGKEMTVASISFFGERGTYPILAAPTCKQESQSDMEYICELIIGSWGATAAAKLGEIWSFATDGDATRRAAGYKLFVRYMLSNTSKLYGTLSRMPGLNLFTGLKEITLDFDWKHILKRICTLLRSPAGIVLNGGRVMNPAFLSRYLLLLDGQDTKSVRRLLFPDDPQDVPRAIELMKAIIALRDLKIPLADPSVIADLDAIKHLAYILEAILEPFTNVKLSLTDQVRLLSTYAHLTFTSFRLYRLAFMSNQLYGDSQTMVKNAMFCICKQQILDRLQPFYFFDLGDDRLEKLFGRIRMLGGHDSGINYRQGVERLGHAMDIDQAYMRQPDLDKGQRRLSTTRTEALDHLNAIMWEGNVIAGDCDLPSAWAAGAAAASEIISQSQMPCSAADFKAIFADSNVDLLRPFANDKYPGIETDEPDRSIADEITPLASSAPSESASPASSNTVSSDSDAGVPTLEELLEPDERLELPAGPGVVPEDWILVKKKWVHKARLCREYITPDYIAKSHNRPERVRGFTRPKTVYRDLNNDDVTGPGCFIEGDNFVALVRTDKVLSVATIRSTSIHEGSTARSSIPLTTIANPKANVKIEGQIMTMRLVPTFDDPPRRQDAEGSDSGMDSDNDSEPESDASHMHGDTDEEATGVCVPERETSPWSWVWNEKARKISVPGHLIRAVNPRIVSTNGRIAVSDSRKINSASTTWELDDGLLGALGAEIWQVISSQGIALDSLPSVDKSPDFPYLFDGDKMGLVCEEGTQQHQENLRL